VDFTEARDSEWQWHQLGHMLVCTSLQTVTTPAPHHSVFLQAGCPSCRPTNSIKALKAQNSKNQFVPKGSRVMLMKQHYNTVILCGILYSAPLPLFFIFLLLLHLHFIT